MGLAKIIGKVTSMPIRIVDIPFRIMRELVEMPNPEEGALADLANAVEKGVEKSLKGE